jgi:hypothetical protein
MQDVPDYLAAANIFEELGVNASSSRLGRYDARKYLFRAVLCIMAATDMVGARAKHKHFQNVDCLYGSSREGKFLDQIITALEEFDSSKFSEVYRGMSCLSSCLSCCSERFWFVCTNDAVAVLPALCVMRYALSALSAYCCFPDYVSVSPLDAWHTKLLRQAQKTLTEHCHDDSNHADDDLSGTSDASDTSDISDTNQQIESTEQAETQHHDLYPSRADSQDSHSSQDSQDSLFA